MKAAAGLILAGWMKLTVRYGRGHGAREAFHNTTAAAPVQFPDHRAAGHTIDVPVRHPVPPSSLGLRTLARIDQDIIYRLKAQMPPPSEASACLIGPVACTGQAVLRFTPMLARKKTR